MLYNKIKAKINSIWLTMMITFCRNMLGYANRNECDEMIKENNLRYEPYVCVHEFILTYVCIF